MKLIDKNKSKEEKMNNKLKYAQELRNEQIINGYIEDKKSKGKKKKYVRQNLFKVLFSFMRYFDFRIRGKWVFTFDCSFAIMQ